VEPSCDLLTFNRVIGEDSPATGRTRPLGISCLRAFLFRRTEHLLRIQSILRAIESFFLQPGPLGRAERSIVVQLTLTTGFHIAAFAASIS